MNMTTSAQGRAALMRREGCRLTAYQDTVGVWTIGVGHTSAAGAPTVTPGLTITQDEADAIFARDLVKYERAVNEAVTVDLTQNQFDACVSLCYNIGEHGFTGSTVVHRLNARDPDGAADAFLMWEKPPELRGRRESERAQFLRAEPAIQTTFAPPHIVPKAAKPQTGKVTAGTGVVVGAGAALAEQAGVSWVWIILGSLVIVGSVLAIRAWSRGQQAASSSAAVKAAPPVVTTLQGPGITPVASAPPAPKTGD